MSVRGDRTGPEPFKHPLSNGRTVFTLNQASRETRRAKSTIQNAIKTGRLSASKDDAGRYKIDAAELFRVFPRTEPEQLPSNAFEQAEIQRLRAELDGERRLSAALSSQVDDLRDRLDKETEERRAATRLLTDGRSTRTGFFGLFRW